MTVLSRLLEPAKWGSLELPNRMYMPPMGTHTANPDGTISEAGVAYLLARAKGGVGLIITESMPVQEVYDPPTGSVVSISRDEHIPGLKAMVEQVHALGGRIAANLTPGFGRIMPAGPDGGAPYSASAVPLLMDPTTMSRELSTEQVEDILARFRAAVIRALECGFDAIDIHGHTGYLTDQFLSAVWNQRTDRFGGDAAGRATFATEMIRAVREEAGKDFPLSMRISVRHEFPGGRTTEEGQELAVILQDAGLDVLLVDAGAYEAIDLAFPGYYRGDGVYLPDAAAVKPLLRIPVAVNGNLTPELGEKALADGIADFIGYGRMIIADPDLPRKIAEGRPQSVRPCIRCNALCIGNVAMGKPVECSVNPEAGYEATRVLLPAPTVRKVAVVGAGPGGLEAARVAAARGHDVTVYEASDMLGGVLEPAATPDFKRELHRMIDWWDGELTDLGVKVEFNHRVEPDDPALAEADAVIVATGSVPLVPPIPGADTSPLVIDVLEGHRGAPVGKRVVVCGGGLSGADYALELAQAGHEVTVVEMGPEIAPDMIFYNRITLLTQLAMLGVKTVTGTTVTAFTDDAVEAEGPDGAVTLPCDTAVLAFGVKPNRALPEALKAAGVEFTEVGDCVKPAKVAEAVHGGYLAAAEI